MTFNVNPNDDAAKLLLDGKCDATWTQMPVPQALQLITNQYKITDEVVAMQLLMELRAQEHETLLHETTSEPPF